MLPLLSLATPFSNFKAIEFDIQDGTSVPRRHPLRVISLTHDMRCVVVRPVNAVPRRRKVGIRSHNRIRSLGWNVIHENPTPLADFAIAENNRDGFGFDLSCDFAHEHWDWCLSG